MSSPSPTPDPLKVPFVTVREPGGEATVFRCGLCGLRFTHGTLTCGSCPLARGCGVVACPRCGHSFPRRSFLADRLRRLFRRRSRRSP